MWLNSFGPPHNPQGFYGAFLFALRYNRSMSWYNRIPSRAYLLGGAAILLLFILILFFMGRSFICPCGSIKLWHGQTLTSESSQHISDWYTPSHIIHGFVFYWILWLIGRKWPIGLRLALALILETGWEILENSDFVINYYRQNTVSLDYYGDSIINSFFDVLFMVSGFLWAWRMPVWVTVTLAVMMETVVAYYIRDNLILNIIMFIYPFSSILKWQMGI